MPVILCQGDIFSSSAKILVNPVNCVGVMGAGLAKEFAHRYPEILVPYRKECAEKTLHLGRVALVPTRKDHPMVLLFPTKNNWSDRSHINWIEQGLESTKRILEWGGVESIAFPKLGCGLGGLPWAPVKELMSKSLGTLECRVEIFE